MVDVAIPITIGPPIFAMQNQYLAESDLKNNNLWPWKPWYLKFAEKANTKIVSGT